MLAFFLARPSLIALALAAGLVGVQTLRLHLADGKLERYETAQKLAKADVKVHEATAAGISVQASSELVGAQAKVVTKYRTLVQRVAADVPEGADRDCVVSQPFVNLWNAAVTP